MSRIGRMPVVIPPGVDVQISGANVKVKGPKGEMQRTFTPLLQIEVEDGAIMVKRTAEDRQQKSLHGLTRALINNMVVGVSAGFERVLEINGVGYRAEVDGNNNLVLYVGYSHPVVMEPPQGISFAVETRARQIKVSGHDKELVGQIAANIRKVRPPEPYKGKGIKYLEETIRRKAGKTGKV